MRVADGFRQRLNAMKSPKVHSFVLCSLLSLGTHSGAAAQDTLTGTMTSTARSLDASILMVAPEHTFFSAEISDLQSTTVPAEAIGISKALALSTTSLSTATTTTTDAAAPGVAGAADPKRPWVAEYGPAGEMQCPGYDGDLMYLPDTSRTVIPYQCGVLFDFDPLKKIQVSAFQKRSGVTSKMGYKATESIKRTEVSEPSQVVYYVDEYTYTCEIGYHCKADYTCWVDRSKGNLQQHLDPEKEYYSPEIDKYLCPGINTTGEEPKRLPYIHGSTPNFTSPLQVLETRTVTKKKIINLFGESKPMPSKDEVCAAELNSFLETKPYSSPDYYYLCVDVVKKLLEKKEIPDFEYAPPCCKEPLDELAAKYAGAVAPK